MTVRKLFQHWFTVLDQAKIGVQAHGVTCCLLGCSSRKLDEKQSCFDRIQPFILGCGCSSDGPLHCITAPPPSFIFYRAKMAGWLVG